MGKVAANLKHATLIVCVILIMTGGGNSSSQLSPQTPIPADTLITLKRSVCYGFCPDYSLSVSADGTVIYRGRKFVRVRRVVRSRITPEKVRELIAQFEQAKYFSLNEKYDRREHGCPSLWTDSPAVVTSIRINGKTKSIYHYHGCRDAEGKSVYPEGLTTLENQIDEIVGTKQWTK